MDGPNLQLILWSPDIEPGVGIGGLLLIKSESLHYDYALVLNQVPLCSNWCGI